MSPRPAPRDPIEWEETLPIRPSSPAWRAVIKAFYGSPLDAEERELFDSLAGGREAAEGGCTELECVVGRRGGKSEQIARLAVFECLHAGHEVALAPGQVGLLAVISPLHEQSKEILAYAKGLAKFAMVKRHVARETASTLEFRNGTALRVMTCDALAVSGPTLIGTIRDEWAKWPGAEAAVPDSEIENSLRPALAPVRGAPPRRLIGITSAYIEEGVAYATEQEHYGQPDAPVLVVRGATEQFNPNIDRAWLERERNRVGQRVFLREYGDLEHGPQWQPSVIEGWIPAAVIDGAVDLGRKESAPRAGGYYVVAIDAAFKGDRFAVAVAHGEFRGGRVVAELDFVTSFRSPKRGTPLSVEDTAEEVTAIAQRFGVREVLADQYSFAPLQAVFARHKVYLTERPWTAQNKPAIYKRVRDGMRDKAVRLCEHRGLISELYGLRGKMTQSGHETIEARAGHDDLASASVMALHVALSMPGEPFKYIPIPNPRTGGVPMFGDDDDGPNRMRMRPDHSDDYDRSRLRNNSFGRRGIW